MIRIALFACALAAVAPAIAQSSPAAAPAAPGPAAAPDAAKAKADAAKAAQAKQEKAKLEKAKQDKAKADKAKADTAKTEKSKTDQAKTEPAKASKVPTGAKSADGKTTPAKSSSTKSTSAKSSREKSAASKATAPAGASPAPAKAAETAPATPPQSDAAKSSARAAAAQVAREIATSGWKLVNVPRPPVLDKALRIAAAKADEAGKTRATASAEKAKAAETRTVAAPVPQALAQPTPPPQPRAPTGIFALLSQGNPDAGASQQGDSAIVRPPTTANAFASLEGPATRVGRLTPLTNPLKPKPTPDTKDDDLEDEEEDAPTPGGLRKQVASVSTDCIQTQLLVMVQKAAEHFNGEAIITSGFRARGRRGSYHRRCAAVDFQITGVAASQLVAYLRKQPGAGGVGTYCHTKSVHLDTGTPRDWHQCAFSRRFALRTPVSE